MKKICISLAFLFAFFLRANACYAHNFENLSAQEALDKLKKVIKDLFNYIKNIQMKVSKEEKKC